MESKTVADILRSRRDILKLGGLGLLAASVDTVWPLNVGATGSMIAMELEPRRRPDDTFPTYMSFNLDKAFPGALSTGFLPPRFSVVDINPESAVKGMKLDQKAIELLEERWRLLSELRKVEKTRVAGYGRQMAGYDDFYETAHRLLSDER